MSPYILVIRRIDCILLFFFSEGGICSLPSDNWAGLTPSVSQNFWKIKGSFTATAKPTNLLKTIRSEPLFRGHYSCQTFRRCYYCFLFFLSFFFFTSQVCAATESQYCSTALLISVGKFEAQVKIATEVKQSTPVRL